MVTESVPLEARRPGFDGGTKGLLPDDPAVGTSPSRRTGRHRPVVLAGGAYLVLSIGVWWNVWSSRPTSTTTCGCGDTSLFTWFLEWPAYALSHGLNPLSSSAMYHPTGVNLLANTSEVAIGVILAPVTWIFGPVATLNVALTLSPVLSALAMFVLLRRWVSWQPAAFVGGLLYGFSPVIIVNLIDAHFMVGMAVVPPLVVLCLDELLIRQRRRPLATGVALGLLVVLQFFIGTEVLVIMCVVGAIAVALIVLFAAWRYPAELHRHARHALTGLAAGAGVAVVLLAYPLWFVMAGPAHFSGLVWPNVRPGTFGIGLSNLVTLNNTAAETQVAQRFGGYQGTALHQTDYLGYGLLLVLLAGLVLRRRDLRLWLFGITGLASVYLTLTIAKVVNPFWVPWQVLRSLPLIQNVFPDRFMSTTLLCTGIMLGIIVDHAHRSAALATASRRQADRQSTGVGVGTARAHWVAATAAAAGVGVALVALVPIADFYRGTMPLAARPVVLPEWFRTVAPHLPPGQVLLSYPSSFGGFQASLTWQAVDRMAYASVEGGGPGGDPQRLGPERAGAAVIGGATSGISPRIAFTPASVRSVRQALLGWGVTRVVIPDQPELPAYEVGFHTSYAVGLMTAALGQRPRFVAHAWVWDPATANGPASITVAAFQACVGSANFHPGPVQTVPDCILGGSG
jgi:hypothetical protein